MSITITSLQVENVKRVKALHLEPSPSGLTVIGGRNEQGKTSVLDAIAWALGGGRREPSNPKREGSLNNPAIHLELSNGLVVDRKGKNGTLSVSDPSGRRGGQNLLDAFVSQFALDLPDFMEASDKEKANILLKLLGIGDQLGAMERDEETLYNQRQAIGRIADSKKKYAEELPEYADAPEEPVSASGIIRAQQDVLARNGERRRDRENREALESKSNAIGERVNDLKRRLAEAEAEWNEARIAAVNGGKAAITPEESTAELEAQLADIEAVNARVAANAQKQAAQDEASQYQAQYNAMTEQLEGVRTARRALLEGADLPLPGLTVENGELLYEGKAWDCMSGSAQLRVAVAIVRKLSPDCGFVLMDKLEQMDLQTMREFGEWLQGEGLQVIATRVSTGAECTIVIEDGLPVGQSYADVTTGVYAPPTPPMVDGVTPMEF